ncbi:MAG: hypothetical protein QW128_06410 [Thermoprotei archaeon]
MSKSLGTLEKLELLIPGFRGYKVKELIREDDRLVRQYLISKMLESLRIIEETQAQVLTTAGLKAADELEMSARKLRMMVDKIKYAPTGYAGLFDRAKVWEEALNKLLDVDSKLAPTVNSIVDKVQVLKNVSSNPDPQVINNTVTSINNLCDEIAKLIQQREMLIIGQDQ